MRWIWVAVLLAVALVAYTHRDTLARAAGLLGRANPWWLAAAVVAIGGVYLCRAAVYRVPLAVLGYSVKRSFLWSTAVVATSLYQLLPAGGATGYAFLTYALRQRGVSTGQASLIALIDTLSYAAAVAMLVAGSLIYLAISETSAAGAIALGLAPGIGLVVLAAWVYALQRDRERFIPLALRLARRAGAVLHRQWPEAPIRRFLEEYYEGKAVIRRHPPAFYRMVGFQCLAVCCDAAALYMAFLAVGVAPKAWVVFMGFVIAMTGLAIVSVPGGGGSFETIMSVFVAHHGLLAAQGLAAATLYRIVAFWLPVFVSLFVLLGFRRRRREIRRLPGAGRGWIGALFLATALAAAAVPSDLYAALAPTARVPRPPRAASRSEGRGQALGAVRAAAGGPEGVWPRPTRRRRTRDGCRAADRRRCSAPAARRGIPGGSGG